MNRIFTTLIFVIILLPATARSQETCRVAGGCEPTNTELELDHVVTIPVVVHVVTDDDGTTGAVSMQEIQDQMDLLDGPFRADNPYGFFFDLIGVGYHANSEWFVGFDLTQGGTSDEALEAQEDLNVDPSRVLNLYLSDLLVANFNLHGFAFYPWQYPEADFRNAVHVEYRTLPGGEDTGTGFGYDFGDIAIHEIGHYLGLCHTWDSCTGDGDYVDDTPMHADPNTQCPIGSNQCGGPEDPINNFMNQTSDACRTGFTAGQNLRIGSKAVEYLTILIAELTPPVVWGTNNTGPTNTHTYTNGTVINGDVVYVLTGTTLEIQGTVIFDEDVSGTPSDLYLGGDLIGDANSVLIFRGGSEYIPRPTFDDSGFEGTIIVEGQGSCIIARAGVTLHLSSQTHTFDNGGFFAVREGGTFVLEDGAEILATATAGAPEIEPGAQFLLGDGARLTFQNEVDIIGTGADPITFSRLDSLKA